MHKRSQMGFSLIELLIAISIIAILSTVFLVNIQRVRVRASDTVTKSFLHDVATFQNIYQIDTSVFAATFSNLEEDLTSQDRYSEIVDASILIRADATFCAEARHIQSDTKFHVETGSDISVGSCPT